MLLYAVHVVLGMVAITTFLARKQLPNGLKFLIVVALFYSVGIVGLINLGMVGAGLWWLVVSSLLLGVLHSPRLGLWATTVSFVFVACVAYGYVNGHLQLTVDANAYVVNASSWATLIIATSIMPYFVFQGIATLQAETAALLKQVEIQRDEITRLATHDQLTDLLMPQALVDRLDHAIARSQRTGKRLAVMFLDLDRFKAVNDRYGHAAGDHLLTTLAGRFRGTLREADTKARIGGDEFIFLLEQPGELDEIALVAQRLIDAAAEPVPFGDVSLQVGISIGISTYPEHGRDADTLRRAADKAMYTVKSGGRNGYRFADSPDSDSQSDHPLQATPESEAVSPVLRPVSLN
jgi:diguanylate cyclase (GGDEF)-like protein